MKGLKSKKNLNLNKSYDICIVGAGVAGTVLAALLSRLNYRILIIEKSFREQEKIIGELLQPGGVECLKSMGLGFLLEEIDAQEVEGYTLFLKDEFVSIPYNQENNLQAYAFRNVKFVTRARQYINTLPQVDLIEGNVCDVIIDNKTIKGVVYQYQNKVMHAYANLTFVCEGAMPKLKLKKNLACESRKKSSYFVGTLLTDCELPVAKNGHVILTGEYPILIYPISSSETRILIDFPKTPKMGQQMRDHLKSQIRPHLPETVLSAFDKAVDKGKFIGMPNQNLRTYPLKNKKNVVLIGDSFNMRHPLTGGGMSAVFNDIRNIFTLIAGYSDLSDQSNIDRIIARYYDIRVRDVANINILADSLYRATLDPYLKIASFNYLKQGNHDAIRILAGIDKSKFNLVKHFANVVSNGINKLQLNNRKKIQLLAKASGIVIPLLLQEGNTKFHRWGKQLLDRFFPPHINAKASTQKNSP